MARILKEAVEHTATCGQCRRLIGYTDRDVRDEHDNDGIDYGYGPVVAHYVTCPGCNHRIYTWTKQSDRYDDYY